MINFIEWLASTSGSTALRESLYMYPWIESAHVLFIAIFFGTLLFVDLRLTGFVFKLLSSAVSHPCRMLDKAWTEGNT